MLIGSGSDGRKIEGLGFRCFRFPALNVEDYADDVLSVLGREIRILFQEFLKLVRHGLCSPSCCLVRVCLISLLPTGGYQLDRYTIGSTSMEWQVATSLKGNDRKCFGI